MRQGTFATRSVPIPRSWSPPTRWCVRLLPVLRVRPVAVSRHLGGAEPTPIGHEFCGVVEEIGDDVTTVEVGDFVVGGFNPADNTCPVCRKGAQANCQHGAHTTAPGRTGFGSPGPTGP